MSPKLLLLVLLALVAFSAVDAKNLWKRSSEAELIEQNAAKAAASQTRSVLRRRRDASKSSESTNISLEADELAKLFLALGWKDEKQAFLTGFLKGAANPNVNVTLVGWQAIYNEDGSVKEYRSVQFVIPPKPVEDGEGKTSSEEEEEEEDNVEFGRMVPHSTINELKEVFEPFEAMGITALATVQVFDRSGEIESEFFADPTELLIFDDDFTIYNRTIAGASQAEVDAFVEKASAVYKDQVTILKFDEKGDFVKDGSILKPHLLGDVTGDYEITDEILLESPSQVAEIAASYPKDQIGQQLALAYNKRWPEYEWRTLVNPGAFFLNRDISINLSYDTLDFDENSNVDYFVYGRKLKTEEEGTTTPPQPTK